MEELNQSTKKITCKSFNNLHISIFKFKKKWFE